VAILAAIVWVRQIDGLLCDRAKRWMAVVVWSTCLVGPIALPATLLVTQIALPTRFPLVVWTLAVAVGLTTWAPLWAWRRGKLRLTIGLAAATVCGQLAIMLWFAFPQVAIALSSRDLALHFNKTREVPSRLLLAQERVGSILFYLDRDLRNQLQPGQLANQDIDDPLPSPRLGTNEYIAIGERHVHTALNDYNLAPVQYDQVGRFRLYRRSDIEPRALTSSTGGPMLR
jgi:hypothetical protein